MTRGTDEMNDLWNNARLSLEPPSGECYENNFRNIEYTMTLMHLPLLDRSDLRAVSGRIDFFFRLTAQKGMKPMLGGFAIALGLTKFQLREVYSGVSMHGFTQETLAAINCAMASLEANFEQVLMSSKQPIPAIFYAKSNLGWHEANETVITHRTETPQLSGKTTAELAQKYLAAAGIDSQEAEIICEEEEEEEEEHAQ